MQTATTPKRLQAITEGLAAFFLPGSLYELKALNVQGRRAIVHHFADAAEAALWAHDMEAAGATQVHVCPNPVRADLLQHPGQPAKAADVTARRYFLIDCDPVRSSGTNASDAEKAAAWRVAELVAGTLAAAGVQGTAIGDSGNGFHLLPAVDLPIQAGGDDLLKSVLRGLDARFGDVLTAAEKEAIKAGQFLETPRVRVEVLTTALCATKVYGVANRKGEPTVERPHRLSRLLTPPAAWTPELGQANVLALQGMLAVWQRQEGMFGRRPARSSQYGRSALEKACGELAGTAVGGRHHALYRHAIAVGEIVAGGELDADDAMAALSEAARACGLMDDADYGPAKVAATIKDGLRDGRKSPRRATGGNGHTANGTLFEPSANGTANTADEKPPDTRTIDDICTIADLIEAGARFQWLWPGWLQIGVCAAIAAPGGTGKTRFCADLIRRIRHGLPWPDGTPMNLAPDTLALWVVADNNHDELVEVVEKFGISENVRVNAWKDDPFGGVSLNEDKDYRDLEHRVRLLKPALVIVDSVGNSTDANLSKQEEAKGYYQPLQLIARRHRCGMMCLTHLNTTGEALGRRVIEKVRTAIYMSRPDKADDKRRLWVGKSNSKAPAALGVVMGDAGNEYDNNPPAEADVTGRPTTKRDMHPRLKECVDWLRTCIGTLPKRVTAIRAESEIKGFSTTTLYKAKEAAGIEEFVTENKKWWRLPIEGE